MRANVGIDPKLLADSHLIAEYRELKMPIGSLIYHNDYGKKKLNIPVKFSLKEQHINFFKNKLIYLQRRYKEVVKEMQNRGFKCDIPYPDINVFPKELHNDWIPTLEDSQIIRDRIDYKLRLKPWLYRYQREYIAQDVEGNEKEGWVVKDLKPIEEFIEKIKNSELFHV